MEAAVAASSHAEGEVEELLDLPEDGPPPPEDEDMAMPAALTEFDDAADMFEGDVLAGRLKMTEAPQAGVQPATQARKRKAHTASTSFETYDDALPTVVSCICRDSRCRTLYMCVETRSWKSDDAMNIAITSHNFVHGSAMGNRRLAVRFHKCRTAKSVLGKPKVWKVLRKIVDAIIAGTAPVETVQSADIATNDPVSAIFEVFAMALWALVAQDGLTLVACNEK